jgi:hypothetical protein
MRRPRLCAEDGTATLEFIATGLILLVPLVYLVLTMAAIQGGALAIEGAARQAARVFVQAGSERSAASDADRAVEFALADYGLHREDATVSISCSPHPDACLTRQGMVTVSVRISVPLPLAPAVITGVPLGVAMQADATQQVSRFWSGD